MDRYPRETVEFIPVNIIVDGEPVTDAVKLCVLPAYDDSRPTSWDDPTRLGDQIGYMTGTLTAEKYPATFRIFGQVTDNPEIPVVACGEFILT